jgi:hypothetical protein
MGAASCYVSCAKDGIRFRFDKCESRAGEILTGAWITIFRPYRD